MCGSVCCSVFVCSVGVVVLSLLTLLIFILIFYYCYYNHYFRYHYQQHCRFISALDVASTSIMSSFLIAFVLDVQYPADDGECSSYVTEDECLSETSIFDREEYKCKL